MDRNIFEDYTTASNTTLKDILVRYRDEITPNKKGHKSEVYRINKLLRHKICLVNLIQTIWWRKAKSIGLVKKLENLKYLLRKNIQPRLAWEITFLKILMEDIKD